VIVSELKKNLIPFFWPEGVPLVDEFDQTMARVRAPDLAALCLDGDKRNGRLEAVVVYVAPDKKHTVTWLNPSNWEIWRQLRALAGDVVEPPVNGYCFVRRVDRDKLSPIAATPTGTAALQSDDTESSPPTTPAPEKQKPGIKPFRDWPNRFLAPEMVRVAYETPGLLRDRPELVRHVRKFLKDEIGWEPFDNKPIHRELARLLSRIT
jgi:hypothetical protein